MMEICNKDHDEIVFNAKTCPLCEIQSQLHDVENELSKAQYEIAELEEELHNKEG